MTVSTPTGASLSRTGKLRFYWIGCCLFLVWATLQWWQSDQQQQIWHDQPKWNKLDTPSTVPPKSSSAEPSTTGQCQLVPNEQETCDKFNVTSLHRISLIMIAIPHTASSTTRRFFKAAQGAWKDTTEICPDSQNAVWSACPIHSEVAGTHNDFSNATDERQLRIQIPANCLLERLAFSHKVHKSLTQGARGRSTSSIVPFTTVRHPAQLLLSHYRERQVWDRQWNVEYPDREDVINTPVTDWLQYGWWRHNLMVKTYATNTALLWPEPVTRIVPSKEDSDHQNSLADKSEWLSTAVARLKQLPFFGMQERMTESLELFQFHTCQVGYPVDDINKTARVVSDEVNATMESYWALDLLLYDEAVVLFDQLVADMRRKQDMGWKCDLTRTIQSVDRFAGVVPGDSFGLRCIGD